MENPKVSIITPCLNSEKTIRQTIESVLHQTYTNIEYIIIDGKSTDGTVDIIREYIPLFSGRLQYISEKDGGIYDAMNKGIKLSKGTLIGIINSDDFYHPNAVNNIISNVTNDDYQVIYGYCRLLKDNHTIGFMKTIHQNLDQAMIPHPTCFVTRKIYQDFGMFLTTLRISSDYEFLLRLYYSEKVTFIQVKEIIANFRLGGACGDLKKSKLEDLIIRHHYKIYSWGEVLVSFMRIYLLKDYK